jgi:putative SOS response-associated peptidase YedK
LQFGQTTCNQQNPAVSAVAIAGDGSGSPPLRTRSFQARHVSTQRAWRARSAASRAIWRRQPYYFTRRDGQPITFAGLWSKWKDKEAGGDLLSTTMVITEPNKFVAEVHDRMPVILEAKDFERWEHGDPKDAAALMKPAKVAGVEASEQFGGAGW